MRNPEPITSTKTFPSLRSQSATAKERKPSQTSHQNQAQRNQRFKVIICVQQRCIICVTAERRQLRPTLSLRKHTTSSKYQHLVQTSHSRPKKHRCCRTRPKITKRDLKSILALLRHLYRPQRCSNSMNSDNNIANDVDFDNFVSSSKKKSRSNCTELRCSSSIAVSIWLATTTEAFGRKQRSMVIRLNNKEDHQNRLRLSFIAIATTDFLRVCTLGVRYNFVRTNLS